VLGSIIPAYWVFAGLWFVIFIGFGFKNFATLKQGTCLVMRQLLPIFKALEVSLIAANLAQCPWFTANSSTYNEWVYLVIVSPIYVYYIVAFYMLSKGMNISQPELENRDIIGIVLLIAFFTVCYSILFIS